MASLKLRPTSFEVVAGFEDNGDVLNPANAIDADSDTPSTFATLERNHYSGTSIPTVLYLSGFIPPELTGAVDTIDLLVWAASVDPAYSPFFRGCYNLFGVAPNPDISACGGLAGPQKWEDLFVYHVGSAPLASHSLALSLAQDLTKVVVQFKIIGTLFGDGLGQFLIYDCYLLFQGDFLVGGLLPLTPDYSIPRPLVDRKVRVPLQNGNLSVRSQGADRMVLDLHGVAGYDEYDAFWAFYQTHADVAFNFSDRAFSPAVNRVMKFTSAPTWEEGAFDTVVWKCTLQEVPV